MEVYLYRCDRCNIVVCENVDRGGGFYMDQCSGCQGWSDYEKIVVKMIPGESYTGMMFVLGEKKDEHSNTGTNQEK